MKTGCSRECCTLWHANYLSLMLSKSIMTGITLAPSYGMHVAMPWLSCMSMACWLTCNCCSPNQQSVLIGYYVVHWLSTMFKKHALFAVTSLQFDSSVAFPPFQKLSLLVHPFCTSCLKHCNFIFLPLQNCLLGAFVPCSGNIHGLFLQGNG